MYTDDARLSTVWQTHAVSRPMPLQQHGDSSTHGWKRIPYQSHSNPPSRKHCVRGAGHRVTTPMVIPAQPRLFKVGGHAGLLKPIAPASTPLPTSTSVSHSRLASLLSAVKNTPKMPATAELHEQTQTAAQQRGRTAACTTAVRPPSNSHSSTVHLPLALAALLMPECCSFIPSFQSPVR